LVSSQIQNIQGPKPKFSRRQSGEHLVGNRKDIRFIFQANIGDTLSEFPNASVVKIVSAGIRLSGIFRRVGTEGDFKFRLIKPVLGQIGRGI
jgi:hypothetical protein